MAEDDVGDEMAPLLCEDAQANAGVDEGEEERPGLSTLGTATMTINTIVGAGILGLPYAFYHSGGWLALGCLVLATLLSGINVGYLVEVTGWCEGFQTEEEQAQEQEQEQGNRQKKTGPDRFEITNRKFEMSEMCGMLLAPDVSSMPSLRYFADEKGKIQLYRRFLEFAFFSYCFGSCWLYSAVFASTLSMLIKLPGQDDSINTHVCWDKCDVPQGGKCGEGCVLTEGECIKDSTLVETCYNSYRLFLLVYLACQVGMCFVNLNTFKNIQVVLSGSALLAILLMVTTSILAIATDTPDSGFPDHTPEFNPAGIVSIITTGLFAQMCHQGVPVIIHMSKNKGNAKRIFSSALAYTLVLYAALGFCCSYHLGPKTNPIITLNYIDYDGGVPPGTPPPFWALAVRWIVLLFPVCSVSAAFSLQILPLAETLCCLLPPSALPSFTDAAKVRLVRILLTFLPIVAAAGLRDVERILEFNGIFGFVIGFFTPCFLQLAAVRRANTKTPYWDFFSAQACTETVIFVCSILFVVTVYQTVRDYTE